jgi:uncharacterized membrane protein HdeD (DUF308 family)
VIWVSGLAWFIAGTAEIVRLLAVGDRKDDRAVAGLGIVGIVLASAIGVGRPAVDSEGASAAAIASGLILLGGAIAVIRMSASNDVSPVPPPPVAY